MAFTSSPNMQNKMALDYFVQTPVSREMILYLAQQTMDVIRCDSATHLLTPPSTPPQDSMDALPSLEEFITAVVKQSHVQVATLMPTLVYLARLKAVLPPVAQGISSTNHRVFLAALILSAKNLNDSSPKNKHWARYTTVPGYPHFCFSNNEVNLMEMQLLGLLNFDLRIRNDDLFVHLEPFLAPIRVKQQQQAYRRLQAQRQREYLQAPVAHHAPQLSISYVQSQPSLSQMIGQSCRYDSPQVYATPRSRASSINPASRSSSRPPLRTPSLSPPSRCESRSTSSSIASDSPASVGSMHIAYPVYGYAMPAKPQEVVIAQPTPFYHDDPYHSYCHTLKMLPPLPARARPAMPRPAMTRSLPQDDQVHKPMKKQKTSGNIFSRFLSSAPSKQDLTTQTHPSLAMPVPITASAC